MYSRLVITLLIAAGMFGGTLCCAQVTTSTLYGIVNDPSGAPIPGATVTLINEGTAVTYMKSTDQGGEYVFDFLQVGRYRLRIEAKGFKTYQATGLELTAAQNIRQKFALELGDVSETVNVQASAPLVNTVSTEQLETFTMQKVTELPLAQRNYSNLLQIGTGVTNTSGATRLNGLGRSGSLITLDGTDANATRRVGRPPCTVHSTSSTPSVLRPFRRSRPSRGSFRPNMGRWPPAA